MSTAGPSSKVSCSRKSLRTGPGVSGLVDAQSVVGGAEKVVDRVGVGCSTSGTTASSMAGRAWQTQRRSTVLLLG